LTHDEIIDRHGRQNERVALAVDLLSLEPDLYRIMAEVAVSHGLLVEDILPPSRLPCINQIMHEFFYRALTETTASTALIGHASARDHTTVMYGSSKWCSVNELPFPRGSRGGRYVRKQIQQEETTVHGA
jgi:hypothetical protein